jgi:hypothetical protein
MRTRPLLIIAAVVVLIGGGVAAVTAASHPDPVPSPPARLGTLAPTPVAPRRLPAPPPAKTPFDRGIDAAARRGLNVWIEVDLPAAWVAGPRRWRQTLDYVAGMARRPGVAGVKIADELGYQDRIPSADGVVAFLRAARADLARVAPGKKILVDFYVSDAGCLPGTGSRWARDCAAEFRRRHPRCTLEAVERYLRTGTVDVVDYAPEILTAEEYDGGIVDAELAMRTAWREARRRGWDRMVTLNGRLAAGFPGRYPHDRRHAERTLRTELDVPILMGAPAVDVWTWRQNYEGGVYHLTDPGLRPNHLWRGLLDRRARGARLFTHFDPTIVDQGLDADLDVIKTVFSDIYVMPGLGW